jgi:hypothetical protein
MKGKNAFQLLFFFVNQPITSRMLSNFKPEFLKVKKKGIPPAGGIPLNFVLVAPINSTFLLAQLPFPTRSCSSDALPERRFGAAFILPLLKRYVKVTFTTLLSPRSWNAASTFAYLVIALNCWL